MKFLLSLLIVLFTSTVGFSQDLIAVQSGGNASFFESIDSALAYAQNGDYIYLPGGNFYGNFIIDKGVHIIGIGFNTDSSQTTGITYINGNVLIVSGADGGSLQGLFVQSNIEFGTDTANQEVHNFHIYRCSIGGLLLGQGSATAYNSNNLFSEVVFRSHVVGTNWGNTYSIVGGSMQGFVISNCIITKSFVQINDATVKNSIILNQNISNFTNSLFYNNIVLQDLSLYCNCNGSTGNQFFNNVFTDDKADIFSIGSTGCRDALTCNTAFNNVYNILPQDIFQVWNSYNYDPTNQYKLKVASPAVGFGNDGTDAGIYGGSSPWKDGSIPSNPHIQQSLIGGVTTPQGDLNINIKVRAQDD